MSHPSFHADGLPVAPSALAPDASVWRNGAGSMVECPTPRALETEEIDGIVEQFRRGVSNAITAGFDGVEIHGANGDLIDQLLSTTSNLRTDQYGGPIKDRIRLAVEAAGAVETEIGAERVGIRLALYLTARNIDCPEVIASMTHLVMELTGSVRDTSISSKQIGAMLPKCPNSSGTISAAHSAARSSWRGRVRPAAGGADTRVRSIRPRRVRATVHSQSRSAGTDRERLPLGGLRPRHTGRRRGLRIYNLSDMVPAGPWRRNHYGEKIESDRLHHPRRTTGADRHTDP